MLQGSRITEALTRRLFSVGNRQVLVVRSAYLLLPFLRNHLVIVIWRCHFVARWGLRVLTVTQIQHVPTVVVSLVHLVVLRSRGLLFEAHHEHLVALIHVVVGCVHVICSLCEHLLALEGVVYHS